MDQPDSPEGPERPVPPAIQDEPPAAPAKPPRHIPWVTIVLAVANVAVFAWQLSAGAHAMQPTPQWMLEHGGNFGASTLDGEQWRLFTSMFLHYGVLHLVMNMIGLLDGGRHVERMYGRAGFLALYLVAGLAGSFATSLRSNVVSAGASGAIFGVFGAFAAFLVLHRKRLDKEEVAKQSRGLLVFLAYNIYFGVTAQGIDLVAHAGGLAAGFLAGLALEIGTHQDQSSVRRSLVVAVVGVGLVLGGAMLASPPTNAIADLGKVEAVVLERWNKAVAEIQAGTMADDAAADVIEKELLPPWRKARLAYEKDGDGRGNEKIYPLMVTYLTAREDGWAMIAQGLRAKDEALTKRGLERFAEGDAVIAQLKATPK
ncbi:MAG: rhomboid family intramembrane serine protease [Deltaproteobacteria bacterium]|nr:rhomboid family intramembrane serine protease [Deltaproteobacteria bacterium]MDQ3301628.1 rhomboid family intramembrane serine protease [Myxococcota bacterium]